MIAIGELLPSLRCFVAGTRATDLREIEPGDHLVVYIAGAGVISSALDDASRWPLPTMPRTAFAIIDHASAFDGFLRTHTVEDVALTIRRALDPPPNAIRAVVVSSDRTVLDIVDEADPSVLRSRVSVALSHSRAGLRGERLELVVDDPEWARWYRVLADRASMILSPLVADTEHVGSTAVPGLLALSIVDIALVFRDERNRSEAVERLVGVGYGFVGDLGFLGRDLLVGPSDEPRHHLHLVGAGTPAVRLLVQFRNALRHDADLAARYGESKRLAAAAIDTDLGVYTAVKRTYFEG